MESASKELTTKTIEFLDFLLNNQIIDDDTYKYILPNLSITTYTFSVLGIYKELLFFLGENLHKNTEFNEYYKIYVEFFNIEKEKHYIEYKKLFKNCNEPPPFFI